ncbi:Formin-like protein [Actinidia chinensis var. chinensis]|uniref:Formin-like protein n=1 Tax=Actinidia chinensis var. chinensis TaxID=1590841 RepID=A0A2R6RF80_ACTCC|nr:Formin-like protein [Actinidia chinensis var. chinensis]
MAAKIQSLFQLLVFISCVPLSFSQFNSAQNIQTFYPFRSPPIGQTPTSPPSNGSLSPPPPAPPLSPPPPPQPAKPSSKKAVAKAVAVTAASTLVLSGLLFFLLAKYSRRKREQGNKTTHPYASDPVVPQTEFSRFNGNLKGVIVDEEGLDVLYWRNLEGENVKDNFTKDEEKQVIGRGDRRGKSVLPIQEIPLLKGKSSSSHQVWPEIEDEKQGSSIQQTTRSPPPIPPPPPPVSFLAIPPPPVQPKKGPAPQPPLPKPRGLASSFKPPPPPPPKGIIRDNKQGASSSREGMAGDGNGQVKLKPLHWDKVNLNVDHSMVWHKIDGGSFRFDDDLMEVLFGNVATNRKSPRSNNQLSTKGERSNAPAQVFILDSRKSQNTAIVLRSLAISRKEIIDSLTEGHSLDTDTLEKLTRIAPTREEESEILAFDGDPTRLADAESFLFHLLKAIPSAFTRFNAMLFRSNYDSEILQFKELLQTLELGCQELRTRGLFLKLLEAILKAGNRMNAGTTRGNAQAFNLTALRKLSDVKSSDGKTTLLRFVVEEVVRAEGKRCVLNRSRSLSHSSSRSSNNSTRNNENSTPKEDRDREYTMLGLAVVGGLSSEFSNVKKAATIDHDAFSKTCSELAARIVQNRLVLTQCNDSDGGGFLREMKSFLGVAEEEVKVVKEEEMKAMELVKRTTDYYQSGNSKEKEKNPLQLFVIVNDFLGMVDKECIDITKNLQKRRSAETTNAGSSSPRPPGTRISVKFPILPANFMSDNSKSSSSESDDDS